MEKQPESVTCSERVRMNALAGVLFIVGGDAILLVAVFNEHSGSLGSIVTALFGVFAVLLGFYYMLCFINKRINVSDDGVIYSNWTGKANKYPWDKVTVSHHPGRNAHFIFNLDGKKVTFYGYALNALALHEYLLAHGHYDDDTMRNEKKAAEEEAERIKAIQQKAQEKGLVPPDDDDDDDDWE